MNKTYEQWLAKVDAAVDMATGMSLSDLPDCNYRDWYEDNVSVESAAKRAIRNANE